MDARIESYNEKMQKAYNYLLEDYQIISYCDTCFGILIFGYKYTDLVYHTKMHFSRCNNFSH